MVTILNSLYNVSKSKMIVFHSWRLCCIDLGRLSENRSRITIPVWLNSISWVLEYIKKSYTTEPAKKVFKYIWHWSVIKVKKGEVFFSPETTWRTCQTLLNYRHLEGILKKDRNTCCHKHLVSKTIYKMYKTIYILRPRAVTSSCLQND